MLRRAENIKGYEVQAVDGPIGKVADFYFDGREWVLRYLVVDTGGILSRHRVLLSTSGLFQPEPGQTVFPIDHTREEVETAPDVDTEKPVSRQQEQNLHAHFRWMPYWNTYGAGMVPGGVAGIPVDLGQEEPPEEGEYDPHLRSWREVSGYLIHATNGDIGKVEDLIFDDASWNLPLLMVDTGPWLKSEKRLLLTDWVDRVDWANAKVHVDLDKDAVERAPRYDPAAPLDEDTVRALREHYGRPSPAAEAKPE